MIGRLQNELVAANAERSRQYQELAATKRQLERAESQVLSQQDCSPGPSPPAEVCKEVPSEPPYPGDACMQTGNSKFCTCTLLCDSDLT